MPRGLGAPPPRNYRVCVGFGWLWVRMGGILVVVTCMPAPGFAMRVGGAEGGFVWFQMRPLGARAPGALPPTVRGTLWALCAWLYAVYSNPQLLPVHIPEPRQSGKPAGPAGLVPALFFGQEHRAPYPYGPVPVRPRTDLHCTGPYGYGAVRVRVLGRDPEKTYGSLRVRGLCGSQPRAPRRNARRCGE